MNLGPGTVLLDRYELQNVLGRGGMGTVYRAHDAVLKRDVAIKLLTGTGLVAEGRARLLREAQSAAALNHPNIITVHDTGVADIGGADTGVADIGGADTGEADLDGENTPYVVMELVEGKNLHEDPPKDLEHSLTIAKQLCAALDHAHSHGIIHRDLKPENVLLTADGTSKLADFGLARSTSSRLTSEGAIVGTLDYIAPELALGKEFDGRADLYAFGVMLYELTTGRLPFEADDPISVITQHLYAPVVPPRVHNDELPTELDALIVSLLAKEPEKRPKSAREVSSALDRIDLEEYTLAPPQEISMLDRIVRGRFVGREKELEEVRIHWTRAARGEGQTLLISGEPGIGKTRLVQELATHAELTGGLVLAGNCYVEGGAPYDPLSRIVRGGLKNIDKEGVDLPVPVLADVLKLAPELQPDYSDITLNPPLEPETEQRRMFENIITFFKTLCQQRPLLVILEDAHWADSGSLALLKHLARRLTRQTVLVVATYRDEQLKESSAFSQLILDLNRERLAERIELPRLSQPETNAMLAAMFTTEITPVFLNSVYRETEGNPYFIEEICKSLVEKGQIYHENGSWHRRQTDELVIPQSIRMAIQSRFTMYPEAFRKTYDMAAILGREFEFDLLAAASDLDEDTLIDAIEAAERAQLIEEMSSQNGVTFSFAHALIPACLSEGVHTLRRKQLHQRAAHAIESLRPEAFEELAHHYKLAGDKDKARRYYTRAGERAAAAFANQEAEFYFHSALDLDPSSSEEADLLSNLAEVIARAGRLQDGIDTWMEASRLFVELGNTEGIARSYSRMAHIKHWLGDPAAAADLCKQGLAIVTPSRESPDLANLIHELARSYLLLGEPEQAEPACQQALEMARRISAKRVEADALITIGILASTETEDAIAALEEAIAISQAEKLPDREARAHNNLGTVLTINQADSRASREHYISGANIFRQLGDIGWELFALTNAIGTSVSLGEFSRIDWMSARLNEIGDQLVDPGRSKWVYQQSRALLEHAAGNLEKAAEQYRVCYQQIMDSGYIYVIPGAAIDLGTVLYELDVVDEAESIIEQGVKAADQCQEARVDTRAVQAMVLARRGDSIQARQVYNNAAQLFVEHSRAWPGIVLAMAHAQVLMSEKRWDEAFAAFQEAADLLANAEDRFQRAILLQDWARTLLDRGFPEDIDRAQELYQEALSEFEDMGSPGYVKRILAKLTEMNAKN